VIEEAAAEFEATATRRQYGDDPPNLWSFLPKVPGLGRPIRGGAENSVRRDDSDLVVFCFPKSQDAQGVCRAFWLAKGCLRSGDNKAPRKRPSGLPLSGPN
jgi:hypothetical protein